jgi:hypothetical protein
LALACGLFPLLMPARSYIFAKRVRELFL